VADISTKRPSNSATIDFAKFATECNSKLATFGTANSVADMPA
jgi:hypothetical protein